MHTYYSKTLDKKVTISGNDSQEEWSNWIAHVTRTYEIAASELETEGFTRHPKEFGGDYFTKDLGDIEPLTVELSRKFGSDKWTPYAK